MRFKPFCSTEIRFAKKNELKESLLSLDTNHILLIMSQSSARRWDLESFTAGIQKRCESSGGVFVWINTVPANPTQKDLQDCLQQIGSTTIDTIVAFGGGSAIDLAKGISAFYNKDKNTEYTLDELTDQIKSKGYRGYKEYLDIIAVPSTAGTGSEVTQWATIWDHGRGAKFSIDDPRLLPKLAMIVPELTATLPAELTIATGLDAMCQAIEAYWSRHTTPVVQEIAYRAVELSIKYLRSAVDQPKDINIREKLCRASVLAGLAFSQTRTTACHSISYPLTMLFAVPHGLAASITLDGVGAMNKGHFPNDKALFQLFDEFGGIRNYIDEVCRGIITMRLSGFQISQEDIPIIVRNAFTGGRMDNNPVDLSEQDVKSILESVL
jgi:alcohol dehydrogenase class IV